MTEIGIAVIAWLLIIGAIVAWCEWADRHGS
jgi:hypothetical protein